MIINTLVNKVSKGKGKNDKGTDSGMWWELPRV
jgi:hypothetical protein